MRKGNYEEREVMKPEDYYEEVELECGCIFREGEKKGVFEISNICEDHDPTIYHEDWED